MKSITELEGQLVENARQSAQFSARLSHLESGESPMPVDTTDSGSVPNTAEHLEQELNRAKQLVSRLEVCA